MITWPLSPIEPPPMARRSTLPAASASARVAIAPGSFFSWTTNCLAIEPSAVWAAILRGLGGRRAAIEPLHGNGSGSGGIVGAMTSPLEKTAAAEDLGLPPAVTAALWRLPADAGERSTTSAAGIPFSSLTWGDPDDRPLILIHGVTASATIWWRIGPALAASGRRVVAVDLPGHGLTGHWVGHHRFRDNAADVAAWIRAAGLDVPEVQVVGHSWGAVTAAALPVAGIRPATLVLLDPPAIPLSLIALMASDRSQVPD